MKKELPRQKVQTALEILSIHFQYKSSNLHSHSVFLMGRQNDVMDGGRENLKKIFWGGR